MNFRGLWSLSYWVQAQRYTVAMKNINKEYLEKAIWLKNVFDLKKKGNINFLSLLRMPFVLDVLDMHSVEIKPFVGKSLDR